MPKYAVSTLFRSFPTDRLPHHYALLRSLVCLPPVCGLFSLRPNSTLSIHPLFYHAKLSSSDYSRCRLARPALCAPHVLAPLREPYDLTYRAVTHPASSQPEIADAPLSSISTIYMSAILFFLSTSRCLPSMTPHMCPTNPLFIKSHVLLIRQMPAK